MESILSQFLQFKCILRSVVTSATRKLLDQSIKDYTLYYITVTHCKFLLSTRSTLSCYQTFLTTRCAKKQRESLIFVDFKNKAIQGLGIRHILFVCHRKSIFCSPYIFSLVMFCVVKVVCHTWMPINIPMSWS